MSRPDWLQRAVDADNVETVLWNDGGDYGVLSNAQGRALVEAADIVLALAAVEAYEKQLEGSHCILCGAYYGTNPERRYDHADACPWKRSRLWMEQHSQ